MKVILMVIYFAFTFAPILVAVTFLRKWTGEMQETTYWWVLQPIEERWCWLASAGMSWLIIAALGAFAFFGPA